MNKEELLELINKDIDNELNPDEKLLLENEISNNTESRKKYEELKQLSLVIERDAEYSHKEINIVDEALNKINKNRYPVFRKRFKILPDFKFSPKNRIIFSYSFGVLTGIILFAIAYSSGIINRIDPGISGTMTDFETYSNFEKGGEINISQDKINGTVKSQFKNNMVIVSLNFNSTEKYAIDCYFDDNLKLYSIKPLQVNNLSNFSSTGKSVLFMNEGDNKYMILFRRGTQHNVVDNIKIKLTSESKQLKEYSLSISNY